MAEAMKNKPLEVRATLRIHKGENVHIPKNMLRALKAAKGDFIDITISKTKVES